MKRRTFLAALGLAPIAAVVPAAAASLERPEPGGWAGYGIEINGNWSPAVLRYEVRKCVVSEGFIEIFS